MPYIIEKTFNSEIFTKVGNPTITDDGIASGFSASNNITATLNTITPQSSIILKGKGIYSSTPNAANRTQTFGRLTGTNSNPSIEYNPSSGKIIANRFHTNSGQLTSAQIEVQLNDGDVLEYEVIATSTSVTLNVKVKGISYTNTWNGNGLYFTAINGFQATYPGNYYWTGSIDLKQFKITVDGKVVLNGTTSKEVYVLPSMQELKDYYSNTLIVQYNGKPKAKATIEMLVDLVYDNVILNQIQEAFDWKTAVGKQLDIIGQWVGVSRVYQQNGVSGKTYLSYPGWDDETDTLQHGYSDYTTFDVDTGNDLTYKELETLEANLNDDDYKTVIGLKIIKNNINHTAKNIDDAIWEYFNGQVYTTWSDYEITYHYPAELTTIIEVCNTKNVLLAPIGININLLQTE